MKIIDNKMLGKVYDELKSDITKDSKLSVISAYFTIYAYSSLKKELDSITGMRFLFTEPTFTKENTEVSSEFCIDHEKAISGNQFEIKLRNEMRQSLIAKECADWIRKKVEVRSLKKPNPAQPRMIYINNGGEDNVVINGIVDFTTDGLGITPSDRIDSNMCMEGSATISFLQMFDQINDDHVKLFFKIPDWFRISTPTGDYNPDWAVLLEFNGDRRLYFVFETKGNIGNNRPSEEFKIEFGRRHFKVLDTGIKYEVKTSLRDLVLKEDELLLE